MKKPRGVVAAIVVKPATMDIKVRSHEYHRNGISGLGFYALQISFTGDDGTRRNAIATVCGRDVENFQAKKPHDPATRILMYDHLNNIDISETMRGDHFHEDLCRWIIEARGY